MPWKRRKVSERRRCYWSRHHCFFFILLMGIGFFFYTNVQDVGHNWNPDWWINYNMTPWWILYRNQTLVSPSWNPSSSGSSAFPHNFTSTERTLWNTEDSSQNSEPVPYKSPGPYLVEYPYEYHFVINQPQKCQQLKPFLVLVVPVAPHNRAHRDVVRNTWGGESPVLGKVVMLMFLLGLQSGEGAGQLQEQLIQESEEHQDLIQSDFLDCYKNLTIKTMVMLEWLDSYCSGASYAMKIDSDMFLNVPNLINMLSDAPTSNYVTGLVTINGQVMRNPNSKWYLPTEVYPDLVYPRYVLGLGYVLSLDLSKKLVEASRHVRAVYIEDVYLGLCMQFLGISPTDPPRGDYFHVFPVAYSRCIYSTLIATTTDEHTDRMKEWEDFRRPGPRC
ncbi:beta-1,3-galactosyltransferase 1-like [Takifugu rubripes]|uniref:beta-1,3-galactosyltransferase 1-like n=1 Tax=Takifugu rubripes TaxID=31033 RepID=UPI001145E986|nr:beta-1,3-galactosyltransferase 1-like [Takifugu rubripes]XP_029702379.1 beta-1,3-galactosyltransferase 1-like [Takifugu rubripes]